MLTLPSSVPIYLATEPVDLRKGFEGLGAIVRAQWDMDLSAGHLFVFVGRRLDRRKILFWDRGGLVIYFKRLEKGVFRIPKRAVDGKSLEMDATDLAMLLDGLDFGGVKKHARSARFLQASVSLKNVTQLPCGQNPYVRTGHGAPGQLDPNPAQRA